MINKKQIKTRETLQVKLLQFLNNFRETQSLPVYKFIQDICLGILKSKSVIMLQIAKQLNEPITVKKLCERFTRHLNKKPLGDKLQAEIIRHQCQGFDDETGIIVDESDIVKTKAKKMEGLQKVRDGSTGSHDQQGYALLNIIAYQAGSTGYEIKPISSDLIARNMELDSVSQIMEDRLVGIILASGNRGVTIFDRGFDNRNLFSFLHEHGLSYIIRSTGERSLIMDGCEQNFMAVAKTVKLDHTFNLQESGQQIKCGLTRVKLRLNPYPVKYPDTTDAWLIVAQFSPDASGRQGYFYFICDFPTQPYLTENAIMEKVLRMYRIRWKIEEVHRHIKQEYGWEKIQLKSYTRLKNMNQLLLLAMCYLYSLKKYAGVFLDAFPNLMKYSNKQWKQIYDFVYYRLSMLIEMCFATVTRYRLNPFAGKWLDNQQLKIPGLKNGGM